jgi:hypothetical protein
MQAGECQIAELAGLGDDRNDMDMQRSVLWCRVIILPMAEILPVSEMEL